MEKGKKFVQNLVQGETAMSSRQALLQDIEDIVFQKGAEEQEEQAAASGEEPRIREGDQESPPE